MAVSDVQLDTGIGKGRAQVFKPLDVQELFDANDRRKQTEELAKARKAKEDEDKLNRVREQLKPPDMLLRHQDALKQQADKVLSLAYSPDAASKQREIADGVYRYGEMARAAQSAKKAADQITIKTAKGEWDNTKDYEDAVAPINDPKNPNYIPTLDPKNAEYDFNQDVGNIQQKGDAVSEFKREPKYVEAIQNIAQDLGTTTIKSMDPSTMTAVETKKTLKDKQDQGWNSLVGTKNYMLFNGVKQIMRDTPGTTEEEALAKIKPIWDNSFDELRKTTLDKTEQDEKFKFGSGGTAENKNWALKWYPQNTAGQTEVDIQKIAPSGYNEVMSVEVFDKNNNKINVEATPVKYVKSKGGRYSAVVAVPILDDKGKQTGASVNYETTPDGYGAVTTKVGLDPYALEAGIGGYKTRQTSSANIPQKKDAVKKPTAKAYKFTMSYQGANYGRNKSTDKWIKIP